MTARLLVLGDLGLPPGWEHRALRVAAPPSLEAAAAGLEAPLLAARVADLGAPDLAAWLRRDVRRMAAWVIGEADTGEVPDGAVLVPTAALAIALAALLAARERTLALGREHARLLDGLAHDVKSRLQGIVGVASLLEDLEGPRLSAQGREWCARLVTGGNAVDRLVAQLQMLGSMPSAPLQEEPVDLAVLVAGLVAELAERYPARIIAPVGVDALPSVDGTARWIEIVARELLDNAVLFDGGAPSRIELSFDFPDLIVADRGPGVAPAVRARICEPFYRGLTRPDGGHGLGLALVDAVARRLGGSVRVAERPGGGSVFRAPVVRAISLGFD